MAQGIADYNMGYVEGYVGGFLGSQLMDITTTHLQQRDKKREALKKEKKDSKRDNAGGTEYQAGVF